MLPYLIPLILILCGIIFYDAQGVAGNRKWLLGVICVYFILFFGLSYRMGWDTFWYMKSYATFPTLDHIPNDLLKRYDHMQPGIVLLWLICRTIEPEYWLFHLVQCAFVNIVIFWFISRYTKYVFTAVLIYFISYSFYFGTEIVRESIAICIFLLFYRYLVRREWIKYYIGVGLAFMFHASAILLVIYPLVIIFNLKFNKQFLVVCLIFGVIGTFLVSHLSSVISMLGVGIAKKVTTYMMYREAEVFNMNWYIFRVARNILLPIGIILVYKKILKEHVQFEGMICLYILFGIGVFLFEEISARFSNYPMPFYLLSVSTLIGYGMRKASHTKLLAYVTLLVLLIVQSYEVVVVTVNNHQYYPYEWVLDPKIDAVRESSQYRRG